MKLFIETIRINIVINENYLIKNIFQEIKIFHDKLIYSIINKYDRISVICLI